jgi:8-oxo-dGTP pyrophosphatase MutT (NUDIX family)
MINREVGDVRKTVLDLDAHTLRYPLAAALVAYSRRWPQAPLVREFLRFLRTPAAVFDRSNKEGHFTGSTWLVSPDGKRVLLSHHRKLNLWVQLGGHADGDTCLPRVALREAEEESGLHDLRVDSDIFDLDRHRIPARGDEPTHWHYDVCYVARASGDEKFVVSGESHALAWRDVVELASDPRMEPSLRRMARKWLIMSQDQRPGSQTGSPDLAPL